MDLEQELSDEELVELAQKAGDGDLRPFDRLVQRHRGKVLANCRYLTWAGAALAFGLSFGLGSRSLVSNILAGFYVKRLFEPGTEVEVEGRRGLVTAVSTTSTVLEHESGELVLANETLLAETASIHRG